MSNLSKYKKPDVLEEVAKLYTENADPEKIHAATLRAILIPPWDATNTSLTSPFESKSFNPDELALKAQTECRHPYDILGEWIDNQKFTAKKDGKFFAFNKKSMETALHLICFSLLKDQKFEEQPLETHRSNRALERILEIKPTKYEETTQRNEAIQKATPLEISLCRYGSQLSLLWMNKDEILEHHKTQDWPYNSGSVAPRVYGLAKPEQRVKVRPIEKIFETNLDGASITSKDPAECAKALNALQGMQQRAAAFHFAKTRPEVLLFEINQDLLRHPIIQAGLKKAAERCTPELAEKARDHGCIYFDNDTSWSKKKLAAVFKDCKIDEETQKALYDMDKKWKVPEMTARDIDQDQDQDIPF